MGETRIELFEDLKNESTKKPELGASNVLILIYLFLSLMPALVTLVAYTVSINSNSVAVTQALAFSLYSVGLISYVFTFVGGIVIVTKDTYRYARHGRLVLYGTAMILGSIFYPLLNSLSPFAFFIAALLTKTSLGIIAQENIFYFGGALTQLLLINLPIIALGLLLFERRLHRNLLLVAFLLFLSVLISNIFLRMIFPLVSGNNFSSNGISTFYPLLIDIQSLMETIAYIFLILAFVQGGRKLRPAGNA